MTSLDAALDHSQRLFVLAVVGAAAFALVDPSLAGPSFLLALSALAGSLFLGAFVHEKAAGRAISLDSFQFRIPALIQSGVFWLGFLCCLLLRACNA